MCTGIECWRVGPVESPNVAGLVYIAAFGLAECETLGALSRKPHPPQRWRISSPTHMDTAGSEGDFVSHFAADVDSTLARVMYAVQQPLAASAFGQVMGVPAWKSLPSWYLVAELDEAIPPNAEREFARRPGPQCGLVGPGVVGGTPREGPGLTQSGSPVDVGDATPGDGQPRVAPARLDHPYARLRSTAGGTRPVAAHDQPSTVRRPSRSVVQPGCLQEYPGVGAVGVDGHHRRSTAPVELATQRERERDAVSSRGPRRVELRAPEPGQPPDRSPARADHHEVGDVRVVREAEDQDVAAGGEGRVGDGLDVVVGDPAALAHKARQRVHAQAGSAAVRHRSPAGRPRELRRPVADPRHPPETVPV